MNNLLVKIKKRCKKQIKIYFLEQFINFMVSIEIRLDS